MGIKPSPPILLPVNLSDLRAGKSKVIRGVVDSVAAAASVFTPASDKFDDAIFQCSSRFASVAGPFFLK